MSRKKVPQEAKSKANKSSSHVSSADSDNNSKIVWDFSRLVRDGDFGFHKEAILDEVETLDSIFEFLFNYSTKTWGEIRRETRPAKSHSKSVYKHHEISFEDFEEKNPRFLNEAKCRFRNWLEEYNGFYSFYVKSRMRILGIKSGSTFYVLFLDPRHLAYPVEKRNT